MLPKLLLISLLGFSSSIFFFFSHELGDPNTNINISEVDEKMGGHTISQYVAKSEAFLKVRVMNHYLFEKSGQNARSREISEIKVRVVLAKKQDKWFVLLAYPDL